MIIKPLSKIGVKSLPNRFQPQTPLEKNTSKIKQERESWEIVQKLG